jgi:hypothetical protein
MNSKLETLKKKVALAWDASVFDPVCLLENSFFWKVNSGKVFSDIW